MDKENFDIIWANLAIMTILDIIMAINSWRLGGAFIFAVILIAIQILLNLIIAVIYMVKGESLIAKHCLISMGLIVLIQFSGCYVITRII